MIPVHAATDVTPDWEDPIIPATLAASLLAQPGHLLLTAKHPNRYHVPPAHLLARLIPHAPADILTLYTPAAIRREGMGKALLSDFLQRARAAHCPQITMEVRASNAAAIGLYEGLGFTRTATRAGYYQTPTEDAVVYTLNLG